MVTLEACRSMAVVVLSILLYLVLPARSARMMWPEWARVPSWVAPSSVTTESWAVTAMPSSTVSTSESASESSLVPASGSPSTSWANGLWKRVSSHASSSAKVVSSVLV